MALVPYSLYSVLVPNGKRPEDYDLWLNDHISFNYAVSCIPTVENKKCPKRFH